MEVHMARTLRFSCLFALVLLTNGITAIAPIAPATIKQQIENSSYYTYSKTIADTAQDVLSSTSLSTLLKTYTINDILGWSYGSHFLYQVILKTTQQHECDTLINALASETDINNIFYRCGYQSFEQLLAKASDSAALKLATLLYKANQTNTIIFQYIIPNLSDTTAKQRLSVYVKMHIQAQLKLISLDAILNETTPTAVHILADYETTTTVIQDLTNKYNSYKLHVAPLLCTIIKDEKKLTNQGYYVFFHSQRWDYLFLEKLYTDLWALTTNKKRPTHYIFPHVRIKGYNPLDKGPLSRTSILQTGRTNFHDRQALLFVNNSLFGKYKNDTYSSSLYFFLSNSNVNGYHTKSITMNPEQIFEHYKLKKLFLKHQAELTAIEQWYNQARTLGTILMIAIPKKMLADYCFAAIPGGYKNPNALNIETFLNELAQTNNKLNNEEFCIIMLDDAMNPEGGIQIKPYHCAETTAYKEFETHYNKLISTLQKEIAVG